MDRTNSSIVYGSIYGSEGINDPSVVLDVNSSNIYKTNVTLSESLFDDEGVQNSTFVHDEVTHGIDRKSKHIACEDGRFPLDSTMSLTESPTRRQNGDLQPPDQSMYLFKLECHHCKESFSKLCHLSIHMTRHKGLMGLFQCAQCRSSFMHVDDLSEHCRRHEYRVRKCLRCNQVFPNPDSYKLHLQTHINELSHTRIGTWPRLELANTNISYEDIVLRINRMLPNNPVPKITEYNYCTLCSLYFTSKARYSLHLSFHSRIAYDVCDEISLCSSTGELGYSDHLEI